MNPSRNAPCHCGSGKKYKKCCGQVVCVQKQQDHLQTLSSTLGLIAEYVNAGRYGDAEMLCIKTLSTAPTSPDVFYLAGLAARGLGNTAEAIRHLTRATQLAPSEASFLCGLGIVLNEGGQMQEAVTILRKTIQLHPQYAEAYNNLGCIYLQVQQYGIAESFFRRVLEIEPRMAEANYNLGCTLEGQSRLVEAEACYRSALIQNSQYFDAFNNLGVMLRRQGRITEAIECFHRACSINPNIAQCQFNFGALLLEYGAPYDAIACFIRAIALQPDFAIAYASLASAQCTVGDTGQALMSCQHAIELEPYIQDHYLILASIHEKQNNHVAAAECYRTLQAQAPTSLEYKFRELSANLPRYVESRDEIHITRQRISRQLEQLAQTCEQVKTAEVAAFTLFNLAYHGENDRQILERAANLVREKIPVLRKDYLPAVIPVREKIHIGFISSRLHNHSIGKLNIGYIRSLDRSRFYVTVIHSPGSLVDLVSVEIDRLADQVIHLSHTLEIALQQITALTLDILHYPDIGMVPLQSLLAHARLAPVQTTSWGHPNTTGIPTIDYFLSMDAAEPPGAEQHYTEQLIRLKRAPACFDTVFAASPTLSRSVLKLPENGRLYGCVQTLIKFHPDFDVVLDEILTRDPQGWVIVIADHDAQLMRRLQERWTQHWSQLVQRVVFIPQQSSENFLAVIANMDVLLDTPYFGSGVSFYESLAQGTPTVTWPGEFLRGRLVAGFYHWLGIDDAPIAATLADYARVAVEYAVDPARRNRIKAQLQEKSKLIYNDLCAVRELEDFFLLAYGASKSNQSITPFNSHYIWPSQETQTYLSHPVRL